jgi:hypothetical protein
VICVPGTASLLPALITLTEIVAASAKLAHMKSTPSTRIVRLTVTPRNEMQVQNPAPPAVAPAR